MTLQEKMNRIQFRKLSGDFGQGDVPSDFIPWMADISPSALYSCSLPLRKKVGKKTPETKWKNMKRWSEQLSTGEFLPDGVYISEKRQELFVPVPTPKFEKIHHILILLPYGNVEIISGGVESDILEDGKDDLRLQEMIDNDANNPLPGYFKSCFDYKIQNPDQIGIHWKRMKKTAIRPK